MKSKLGIEHCFVWPWLPPVGRGDRPSTSGGHFLDQKAVSASWLTLERFTALLASLLLIMFPGVVLGWKTFFHHDYLVFGYPLANFHCECFWRGEVPFWNPLSNCGLPFMAQWNTLTLYPGALVYLLLPMPWSLNLFCLLHLILAGAGAFLLTCHWTDNRLAAGIAGLCFALNGFSQCCLVWPNTIAAVGWSPWLILLAQKAVRIGRRRILLAALAGTMQMLTGACELIIFTWLIAGAVVLADLVGERKDIARRIARFVAFGALVATMTAVQLLPFFELLQASQRGIGYGATGYSMPADGWGNLLVPLFGTSESRYGVFFQPTQNWTTSYYAGIGVVAFAVCAWRSGHRPRMILLCALALVGLLCASGNNGWLYPFLRRTFPMLGFMNFPVKFVVLTVFCLPLLAAAGAASLAQLPLEKTRRVMIAVASVLGALVLGLIVFEKAFPAPGTRWEVTLWNGCSRLAFLVATMVVFHRSLKAVLGRSRMMLQAATLLLVGLDCITLAPNQNPVMNSSILAPGLPHEEFEPMPRMGAGRAFLDSKTYETMSKSGLADSTAHIIALRLMLHMNCNLLDGIAKIDGFFPLYLRDMASLKELFGKASPEKSTGAFDFASVMYCPDHDRHLAWRKRKTALPLIIGGQTAVYADGSDAMRRFFATNFIPWETVILPKSAQTATTDTAQVVISGTQFSNNRIDFIANASGPALVTIGQAFHRNWRAFVDGRPAPLLRANCAFQAIEVPPGEHRVRLAYHDHMFLGGAILSILVLLFSALAWLRQTPPSQPLL